MNERVLRVVRMLAVVVLFATFFVASIEHPKPVSAESAVDARIEVVWPHDLPGGFQDVRFAPLVNVEVYLFQRGTLKPVPDSFSNKVTLRWSRNYIQRAGGYEPAHDAPNNPGSAIGQRVIRNVDGKTFPAWVFNDVPTEGGQEMLIQPTMFFFVEVEGVDCRTNVWAHAPDARTSLPYGLYLLETGSLNPSVVDAHIKIVWPHDPQGNLRPVAEASLVNIGVDLTEHLAPVRAASIDTPPRLLRSLNGGFLESIKTADQTITLRHPDTGYTWQRWVFNDVDVSAARDPLNHYFFAIRVDGVETHTTIWSHGADARTYFPEKDTPDLSDQ